MRDPDRIDKICDKLKEYWHRVPDWRLGRIISNSTDPDDDPFYIEDDEMMDNIERFFRNHGEEQHKKTHADDLKEKFPNVEPDRLRGYLMEELIDYEQFWSGLLDLHIRTVLVCYDRAKKRCERKETAHE